MPATQDSLALKRTLGMFSHFSNFIHQFSKKIGPLMHSSFPLSDEAIKAFKDIKLDIENALITSIDNEAPFTVETDASEMAIAATLCQLEQTSGIFLTNAFTHGTKTLVN